MKYHVKILPGALNDAKELYRWIQKDSASNADKWFNGIIEAINSLEMLPMRVPIAPESKLMSLEIRHLIYKKNYRILFTVDDDTVRIYHIRHTARGLMEEKG
ncbi:MAG: type II toxin-antitoxin system RelE/ParE family toxin [Merismopedia sp. SIO2A8]|nr:type II toxin-antitoxin system RelE/ParE family toxin [Symploca sp. SIO2B6]NET50714.1 type II toxin-antitoxin system RelE/ParE family toxin [Merismopedia sp. SIO2A8]